MRTSDEDLCHDMLDEGATREFTLLSCARTVEYARRRRRRRVAGLSAAGAALCALACLALRPLVVPAGPSTPAAALAHTAPEEENAPESVKVSEAAVPIHFLTDEELLSRFPNRPVALIGSANRHQELVLLDDPRSARAAGRFHDY